MTEGRLSDYHCYCLDYFLEVDCFIKVDEPLLAGFYGALIWGDFLNGDSGYSRLRRRLTRGVELI